MQKGGSCPAKISVGSLLLCAVKEFDIFAIAFSFEFCDGNEAERGGIDAIPQSAVVLGTVGEDMTEMAITVR